MLYIVVVTGKCNLKCKYCGGDISTDIMPLYISYPLEKLAEFVKGDEDKIIAFYGGEPTLFPHIMEKIIDMVGEGKYVLQTNGFFLKNLSEKVLGNLDAILVSIDGRREITDFYRGNGVYDTVVENVRAIRKIYRGDLIARMVATEKTNIYEDVMHLINLNLFDHVHWQLDVVWSDRWNDFDGYLENSYFPGLFKLAKYWANKAREGTVVGIVPFLGILRRIMFGGEGLYCGAGETAVAIATDGKIYACPICGEFEWNHLGDIFSSKREGVFHRNLIPEDCKKCDYYKLCGGRCLFAAREKLWGEEGFRKICSTAKYLIDLVEDICLPAAEYSINRGLLKKEDFNYPKFNNTTEVIP